MLTVVQGGPSETTKTKAAPTAPPSPPPSKVVTVPATVSEHGQGGGTSSTDVGKKPTAKETATGYATPAHVQPKATTPPIPGGQTSAVPTGVNTNTGSASAALQGYTTAGPASAGQAGSLNVPSIEGTGTSSRSGYAQQGAKDEPTGVTPSRGQRRELSGLGGGIGGFLNKLGGEIDDVKDFLVEPFVHATAKALRLSAKEAAVAGTATLKAVQFVSRVERGKEPVRLDVAKLTKEYGAPVAEYAVKHPGEVATIAAVIALAIPTDGASVEALAAIRGLTALSVTASGAATVEDFKSGDYVDGAIDLTGVVVAFGGVGADRLATLAEDQRAGDQAVYRKAVEDAISSNPESPTLAVQQKRDFATIISSIRTESSRAELLHSKSYRANVAAAFAGLTTSIRSHTQK